MGNQAAQHQQALSKATAEKQRRQRQAMIEQSINMGVFDNRDHFKDWMKKEFNLALPIEKISTEYTLSEKQTKLMYLWLRYFTGQGPKPRINRASPRITNAQLTKIDRLATELSLTPSSLADFTKRQTGKRKLIPSLFKSEATKLITGLERLIAEQLFTTNPEEK